MPPRPPPPATPSNTLGQTAPTLALPLERQAPRHAHPPVEGTDLTFDAPRHVALVDAARTAVGGSRSQDTRASTATRWGEAVAVSCAGGDGRARCGRDGESWATALRLTLAMRGLVSARRRHALRIARRRDP